MQKKLLCESHYDMRSMEKVFLKVCVSAPIQAYSLAMYFQRFMRHIVMNNAVYNLSAFVSKFVSI